MPYVEACDHGELATSVATVPGRNNKEEGPRVYRVQFLMYLPHVIALQAGTLTFADRVFRLFQHPEEQRGTSGGRKVLVYGQR